MTDLSEHYKNVLGWNPNENLDGLYLPDSPVSPDRPDGLVLCLSPKSIQKLYDFLNRAHCVYDLLQEDCPLTVEELKQCMSDMHEHIDRAIDIIVYNTKVSENWETDYPGEQKPSWIE